MMNNEMNTEMNNVTANVTKILWFSRHGMTDDQINDLVRIYGQIDIKHVDTSATSYKDVLEAGRDCDVLAVVLPPAMLADLTNPHINTKPVIRSVMDRIRTRNRIINPATGKEEDEYKFVFCGWELIRKVRIVTERL